jgi:sulfofructose kinase
VVADFERGDLPGFADLLGLVDHLIVSLDFGRQLTSATDPGSVAAKLWHAGRQTVVLTDGAAGCWYVAAPEPTRLRHQPAFAVKVVDTTGCGDVFHGPTLPRWRGAWARRSASGLPQRLRL